MSISLQPTTPADLEAEPDRHDYRLTRAQYRKAVNAGIIPGADEVELRDGFLTLKPGPAEQEPGAHYRLSIAQYQAMAERGILTKDDRIELLEGWLIAKMGKNRPHVVSANRTSHLLTGLLPPGWYVAREDPVQGTDSEPEPDISVVQGTFDDYLNRTPGPGDVPLLIEVADSSLFRDRSRKKRLYAQAGFPIYWLINLITSRIEVYTDPTGSAAKPDYLTRQDFGPDEMIPLVIEGREIGRLAVRDLLP
jgi:Uma2 family endonuclease